MTSIPKYRGLPPHQAQVMRKNLDYPGFAYACLIWFGGIYAYIRAGSIPSLLMGLSFGFFLAISAIWVSQNPKRHFVPIFVLSLILCIVFAARFAKSAKIMPPGFLSLVSLGFTIRYGKCDGKSDRKYWEAIVFSTRQKQIFHMTLQMTVPFNISSNTVAAQATNTLILVNIPPDAYAQNACIVREKLQRYGLVRKLALLPSFSRILAIYERTGDAAIARRDLHLTRLCGGETTIKVYFGEHTDLHMLTQPPTMLQVPHAEKNFLLSPPGSPPVGWIQMQESGPTPGGHSQLHDVWHELMNEDFSLDVGSDNHHDDDDRSIAASRLPHLSRLGSPYEDEASLEARCSMIFDGGGHPTDDDNVTNGTRSQHNHTCDTDGRVAGIRIGGAEVLWPLKRDDIGSVPMIVLESSEGDVDHDPGQGSHGLASLPNRVSSPIPRELPRTAMPPIQ
ncbi:hypothetical protein SeLEV6574_g00799 [Synchytrium endobioticum]|nr:hypothetical protein SeLEV6574_g00799 [Synchytrium endobioticum]